MRGGFFLWGEGRNFFSGIQKDGGGADFFVYRSSGGGGQNFFSMKRRDQKKMTTHNHRQMAPPPPGKNGQGQKPRRTGKMGTLNLPDPRLFFKDVCFTSIEKKLFSLSETLLPVDGVESSPNTFLLWPCDLDLRPWPVTFSMDHLFWY